MESTATETQEEVTIATALRRDMFASVKKTNGSLKARRPQNALTTTDITALATGWTEKQIGARIRRAFIGI
jgi:hypothetical protein